MNTEKIKNFNQKLLAVFGCLGILLLLLGIIAIVIEFFPFQSNHIPNGLISDEATEALNKENLRKQIISYESPALIDSTRFIYLIPVSIKTLKEAESLTDEWESGSLGLLSTRKGKYQDSYFTNNYANLILYNSPEEKTISLFKDRIVIGNLTTHYFPDDILLSFYTADKDTDKNGIINLDDLTCLCFYSLQTGEMRTISDKENSVWTYEFIENSKNLLVQFRQDKYKDKHRFFLRKIMKYNYATRQLSPVIPPEMEKQMQQLVEGS